jgi:hypothetical protein
MNAWTLLPALLLMAGCARPESRPEAGTLPAAQPPSSRVEITYELGHALHRIVLSGTPPRGERFVDRQLLRATSVEPGRYLDLLGKVQAFVDSSDGAVPEPGRQLSSSCRARFTVALAIGVQSRSIRGCRSGEAGMRLARLARDADFILTQGESPAR